MKIAQDKYNGWTNYATWRINLEIIDPIDFDEIVTANQLEEIVKDCVFSNVVDDRALCIDYAKAFIDEVNFYEIAHNINERIDLQSKHD